MSSKLRLFTVKLYGSLSGLSYICEVKAVGPSNAVRQAAKLAIAEDFFDIDFDPPCLEWVVEA